MYQHLFAQGVSIGTTLPGGPIRPASTQSLHTATAFSNKMNYNFSGIGKPKNGNNVYGLRYAEFVMPLVKGVQEQQLIIHDLQKQVEACKAEIAMQQKIIEKQQQQINDLKKDVEEIKRNNLSQEVQVAELIKKLVGLELSQACRK
jgi:peptidoglycan hydrolase CwlO-like protein